MGGGHGSTGDGLVAAVVPGRGNVGSGSEDIDDRSEVGVECPAVIDVRSTNGDRLGGVGWASVLGVFVGVTL